MYYYGSQKHKVFISFYHRDDEYYKKFIVDHLSANVINKSVEDGEYYPDDSDAYIKKLIREEKVSDSSVVVVLVGPNTRKRKHVDWEIYAGLRASINGNSGLIAIMLPELRTSPNGNYYYDDLPGRISDNIKSGYASFYSWDYAITHYDDIIEKAFNDRIAKRDKIDNTRLQMRRNLGENE